MYDLICDVITYCIWRCNTAKINASDKIMFENQKREYGNKRVLHKSQSKRLFRHSELAEASWCKRN